MTKRYDLITCGGCDAVWTGAARAHCGSCHRLFAGPSLFDAHRRDGQCLDPEAIMTKPKDGSAPQRAMFLVDGMWQTGTEPQADRAANLRGWRERRAS